MTLDEARALPIGTDEFDEAVDAASAACEAHGPGAYHAECGKVLTYLLQRLDDHVQSVIHNLAGHPANRQGFTVH